MNPHGALNASFQWLLQRQPQSLNDLIRTAKMAGLTASHARTVVDRMSIAGLVTCEHQGADMLVIWVGGAE
jgi:hypothetical protein